LGPGTRKGFFRSDCIFSDVSRNIVILQSLKNVLLHQKALESLEMSAWCLIPGQFRHPASRRRTSTRFGSK
jgi:hypothetical protein